MSGKRLKLRRELRADVDLSESVRELIVGRERSLKLLTFHANSERQAGGQRPEAGDATNGAALAHRAQASNES